MGNYGPSEIRAEREKRNWTQRAFADMIGVTPVSVSKWENGQTEPSYNHMQRIHQVFEYGADPDRLAELEAEVSRLRADHRALEAEVERLARDAEEFRKIVTQLLATDAGPASGEDPQSEPRAGQ